MVSLTEIEAPKETKMFWGVTLEGSKRYTQTVETTFHISMAALEASPGCKEPVSVMIAHDKSEFMLCTLEAPHCRQQPLDLNFTEGEEVTFFLSGKGIVHLTGYLAPEEEHPFDDTDDEDYLEGSTGQSSSDEESSEEDEAPELVAPDASKKRKKNLTGKKAKKLKISMDEVETLKLLGDDGDSSDDEDYEEIHSDEADVDDSEDDEELESDDEEIDEDNEDEEEDDSTAEMEEEEEMEDSEEEEEAMSGSSFVEVETKEKKKDKKKKKSEAAAPAAALTPPATPQLKPIPAKAAEAEKTLSKKAKKKAAKAARKAAAAEAAKHDAKKPEAKKPEAKSPKKAENGAAEVKELKAEAATPDKKKKKKEDKPVTPQLKPESPQTAKSPNKKQVGAGGVIMEDIKMGHGPEAKSGKKISMYYNGKLLNGKQFDSCLKGSPFLFKLGSGEVIKGWDTGVQGMKVGGKRKLTIPPKQAYGKQRMGPIPANSTLVFEVELKAVS